MQKKMHTAILYFVTVHVYGMKKNYVKITCLENWNDKITKAGLLEIYIYILLVVKNSIPTIPLT